MFLDAFKSVKFAGIGIVVNLLPETSNTIKDDGNVMDNMFELRALSLDKVVFVNTR